MDGFPIYGPLQDGMLHLLDECNFDKLTSRYHIRLPSQVEESQPYCKEGDEESVNWNYIVGCFVGDLVGSDLVDSVDYVLDDSCYPMDPSSYYDTQMHIV